MGVKVLRRGDSIFPLQITCQKCGTLLLIKKPQNLKVINDLSTERVAFVKCRVCKSQVLLYKADTLKALDEYDKANGKKKHKKNHK